MQKGNLHTQDAIWFWVIEITHDYAGKDLSQFVTTSFVDNALLIEQ